MFAHNGTLIGYKQRGPSEFNQLGDTDSEWAFCQKLNWFDKDTMGSWSESEYANFEEFLKRLNRYREPTALEGGWFIPRT